MEKKKMANGEFVAMKFHTQIEDPSYMSFWKGLIIFWPSAISTPDGYCFYKG